MNFQAALERSTSHYLFTTEAKPNDCCGMDRLRDSCFPVWNGEYITNRYESTNTVP